MKKTLYFIFSRWYLGLLVVASILLAVSYIFRLLTPPIPIQDNSWQGLTPGYKLSRNITEKLGNPVSVQKEGADTKYLFKSAFEIMPHEVVTNQEEKVVFIKEYTTFNPQDKVDNYIKMWGEPDITTYEESLGDSMTLFVFLEQGVAIAAHSLGRTVEQKWYFEPTDAETFLKTIGKGAKSENIDGPELLLPLEELNNLDQP